MNGNLLLSLWHFEILPGPKLECYQGGCHISKQSNNSEYKYHSYNTARSYNKASYQILKQLHACHKDDFMWDENAMLVIIVIKQSGTKPNLAAKIWPPNLVTICAWLPKLVANVSSQFQHLVNMELALGFLVKWLPIMVAHTRKLDTIWVVYISRAGNGSILL